jgi:hypothetical protein
MACLILLYQEKNNNTAHFCNLPLNVCLSILVFFRLQLQSFLFSLFLYPLSFKTSFFLHNISQFLPFRLTFFIAFSFALFTKPGEYVLTVKKKLTLLKSCSRQQR